MSGKTPQANFCQDVVSRMEDIEGLFVAINFGKSKWFLDDIDHLPSQPD